MVLLVVDAQNGIVDERLYEFRKFVGNIKKLIGTAREQGIEAVSYTHLDVYKRQCHDHGAGGADQYRHHRNGRHRH